MCTSTASKPARSNAAAISTWPLTPCSRRIAIAGRAPVAMNGAATSSAGSKVSARREARDRRRRAIRVVFLVGAVRVVAQPLQRVRGRRPRAVQVDARLVEQHARRRAAMRTRSSGVGRADRRARARPAAASRARTRSRVARRAPAPPRPAPRRTARRAASPATSVELERRGRSAPRTPFRRASRTGRRRRGRDTRAAGRRGAAPAPPRRTRRAAPDRRGPGARRRAGRRPAPAPSRRGDAARRRGRSTAARSSPRSARSSGVSVAPRIGAPARTPRRSATPARSPPCRAAAVAPRRAHRHRVLADRDADAERRAQLHRRPRAPCRRARRPRRDGRPAPSSWPTA